MQNASAGSYPLEKLVRPLIRQPLGYFWRDRLEAQDTSPGQLRWGKGQNFEPIEDSGTVIDWDNAFETMPLEIQVKAFTDVKTKHDYKKWMDTFEFEVPKLKTEELGAKEKRESGGNPESTATEGIYFYLYWKPMDNPDVEYGGIG